MDHIKFAISISKPQSSMEGKSKQGGGSHTNLSITQLIFLHKPGRAAEITA